MLTLLRPVAALVGFGDDLTCIICDCRPHLTLCGRYDPSRPSPDPVSPDDEICRDCHEIWLQDLPCPNCGCRNSDWCDLCERGVY